MCYKKSFILLQTYEAAQNVKQTGSKKQTAGGIGNNRDGSQQVMYQILNFK